jgi:hypothetical protein
MAELVTEALPVSRNSGKKTLQSGALTIVGDERHGQALYLMGKDGKSKFIKTEQLFEINEQFNRVSDANQIRSGDIIVIRQVDPKGKTTKAYASIVQSVKTGLNDTPSSLLVKSLDGAKETVKNWSKLFTRAYKKNILLNTSLWERSNWTKDPAEKIEIIVLRARNMDSPKAKSSVTGVKCDAAINGKTIGNISQCVYPENFSVYFHPDGLPDGNNTSLSRAKGELYKLYNRIGKYCGTAGDFNGEMKPGYYSLTNSSDPNCASIMGAIKK